MIYEELQREVKRLKLELAESRAEVERLQRSGEESFTEWCDRMDRKAAACMA